MKYRPAPHIARTMPTMLAQFRLALTKAAHPPKKEMKVESQPQYITF
tara:strand:+ start:57319 stop:57459 length:141 start_codon:yes stop_codon:yes gene_type:complete